MIGDNFVDANGQICDFEDSKLAHSLADAIRPLASGDAYDDYDFVEEAFALWFAASEGFDLERQWDNTRTFWPSEGSMRDLDRMLEDMERLYPPAFERLVAEIASEEEMRRALSLVREMARNVFYDLDPNVTVRGQPKKQRGQPKKEAAARVRAAAAEIYREITGRTATFTTSEYKNNEISGKWFDFLGRVFSVLNIKASVGSQAKAEKASRP